MSEIIQVSHLRKIFQVMERRAGISGAIKNMVSPRYKSIGAVDDISFKMEEGELVGYLGPNGAGKSTTIKILTGLLVPTSGDVLVNGMVPWKERTRYVAGIGAVFGQRTTLWWDLPVIDSLELLQPLYRIPVNKYKKNLDEFSQILDMQPFLNTPVRSLSLGQRMRADLCAALLHEPRLLFLDEPTIGLDVVAKEHIRRFIKHIHHEHGTTILLTTHDLSDVEKLCDRIMILDHGNLLFDDSLASLTSRFDGNWSLAVHFAEEYPNVQLPGLGLKMLNRLQAVYTFDHQKITSSEVIQQVLQRFHIVDLEVRRPALEDTIRRIYEERLLSQST